MTSAATVTATPMGWLSAMGVCAMLGAEPSPPPVTCTTVVSWLVLPSLSVTVSVTV